MLLLGPALKSTIHTVVYLTLKRPGGASGGMAAGNADSSVNSDTCEVTLHYFVLLYVYQVLNVFLA